MELLAHRGLSARFPENTAAAFRAALVEKADGIETDLRRAADGTLWLFHDDALRDKTGAAGRVETVRAKDLAALRLGGEPLLRLEELLEIVATAPTWLVNLELKGTPAEQLELAHALPALLANNCPPRLVISSFDHTALAALQTIAPEFPRAPLWSGSRGNFDDLLVTALKLKAVALHLSRRAASAPRVRVAHAAGLTVRCYTVNEPAEAERLETMGVDGLFTDDPAALRAAREPAP